jgi:hypothetical protein
MQKCKQCQKIESDNNINANGICLTCTENELDALKTCKQCKREIKQRYLTSDFICYNCNKNAATVINKEIKEEHIPTSYQLPNNKPNLNDKWWYRLLLVLFIIVLLITAIGPFYQQTYNPLLDAVIGVAINSIIMFIIWKTIYYIIFGTKK